jgi:hypothetical protein
MTIPSTPRKAGPFTGNGSQSSWPFTFKVFAAGDVKVTVTDAEGADAELSPNQYTVTLNANQETSPGGAVTYALAASRKLTITGDLDYDQAYDIPSGGNFSPTALENQLDRMVMQTQQLAEELTRAVKVPVTESATGQLSTDLANGILALSPITDDITTVAENVDAITGVAEDYATIADNIADVNNFADVWQGARTSFPTQRNDGGPLQAGDMFFYTGDNGLRVYTGQAWATAASPGSMSVESFSGNGTTTEFILASVPVSENNTQVYIGGVYQQKNTYNVANNSLLFAVAPPTGSGNIEVVTMSSMSLALATDAALVSFAPQGPGAVSTNVQEKLRQWPSVVDLGAVGDNSTINDAAFLNAEQSTHTTFEVPLGIFKTNFFNLTKNYIGPGAIVFGDGYTQNCAAATRERPRNATGPLRISSATDILLDPVGSTNANNRRVTGLGAAVSDTDAIGFRDLRSGLAKGMKFTNEISTDSRMLDWYEEGVFTPGVRGIANVGTPTYTRRYGRFTRIGRTVFARVHVDFSVAGLPVNEPIKVTGLPYPGLVVTVSGAPLQAGVAAGTAANWTFGGQHWFYVNGSEIFFYSAASNSAGGFSSDQAGIFDLSIWYDVAE